jgi:hypothetical protein
MQVQTNPARAGGRVNVAGVGFTALIAAFRKARASGLKHPAMTFEAVTFKFASDTSKNPGHLYVTAGKRYGSEYFGKISPAGQFVAGMNGCPLHVLQAVEAIGTDPLGEAIAHGKKTGNCACCNLPLTNPVSVERGIGPICFDKFFGG